MGSKTRILLSSTGLLALTLACGVADGERLNTGALERYTRTLPLNELALERCSMHGPTRSGYCILRGQPAQIDAFVGGLPLVPVDADRTFKLDCRSLPEYGRADPEAEGARVVLPGGARYRPNGELPPSQDNVHLRAVTIDPARSAICIDYEFPYG